jgi:hypothetical protein
MQNKECSCASIERAKRSVSSPVATTNKINHGLEIRRGNSLGLLTRSSLIGTLMGAGFFMAIAISASAQIAAMQAQIAAQQAQKNADLALQAQLDAISQRDALQAQLEDTMLAASQRDSLQNQPKTGKAEAHPGQQDVASAADQSQPQQEPQSAASEALPVTLPQAAASPSPSPAETHVESAARVQQDEPPAAFTPAALRPKALGRHEHGLRQTARPQPQPTFWQRLFGHKETKKAKPGKLQQ